MKVIYLHLHKKMVVVVVVVFKRHFQEHLIVVEFQ